MGVGVPEEGVLQDGGLCMGGISCLLCPRACMLLRFRCATGTSNIGEKPVTTTALASQPFTGGIRQGVTKLYDAIFPI
jgi:hypothetical protein